jgi:hypothetical protein
MGYANQVPYSYLEYGIGEYPGITITIAGSNHNLATFTLPDWKDPLTYAYLDIAVQRIVNTNALENSINTGTWGILDTGATYRAAGTFTASALPVSGNGVGYGQFVVRGYNNLAAYLTPGATQQFRLESMTSWNNDMYLQGVSGNLRLYFMG